MLLLHTLLATVFFVALPDTAYSNINNASIPFVSVFKYTKLRNATDYQGYTQGYKQACYHKESRTPRGFSESKGEYLNITFAHLQNARFSAQDNYNSERHSIPILFHTRWRTSNDSVYQQLLQALSDNNLLNISFYTTVKPGALNSCRGSKTVMVDIEWCKWARVFTHHKIAGLPRYDNDGHCVVNRSDEAKHYLNMWDTGDSKEFHTRCYKKNKGGCVSNTESNGSKDKMLCTGQLFMANGRGLISKMKMGKSKNSNKSESDYIDVNMTIAFDYWTEEFPEMFTNSHKKCLYHGDVSKLTIHFFLKEDAGRKIPAQFFAFIIIVCFLAVVFAIAFTLVLCTCSTKSFRMELWEYWIKRNAYREYAEEHAEEIAEQMADKRMEKIEAMMTTILEDIK